MAVTLVTRWHTGGNEMVEFDRATGSAVDLRLTGLVRDDGALAVTGPVVMEIIAGPR